MYQMHAGTSGYTTDVHRLAIWIPAKSGTYLNVQASDSTDLTLMSTTWDCKRSGTARY